MNPNIAITGAGGLVGSHLCGQLRDQGESVIGLTRSERSRHAVFGPGPMQWTVCPYTDPERAVEALEGVRTLYHAAGLTRGRTLEEYRQANVQSTWSLIQAAIRAGVERFVLVSSLAAGGPVPRSRLSAPVEDIETIGVTEDDPPRPGDHYGQSKLEAERVALAMADRIDVVIVRPPAVYGPGDHNFFDLFRLAAHRGRSLMLGRGDRWVSLVSASDLATGMILAANKPGASGRMYYLASGHHRMSEVMQALEQAAGRTLKVIRIPALPARLGGELGQLWWMITGRAPVLSRRKVRDLLQPAWLCSFAKAQRELGFTPNEGLTDGFARTIAWYRQKNWRYPKG
ncbi:MAG: NAD-dependent epimerase/dehydratase family protein [Phycisphaeraceae bacterium]|nr:NAD-dependent epimerase/dehydratase family protein [Phycisphaeraceae bacterium]